MLLQQPPPRRRPCRTTGWNEAVDAVDTAVCFAYCIILYGLHVLRTADDTSKSNQNQQHFFFFVYFAFFYADSNNNVDFVSEALKGSGLLSSSSKHNSKKNALQYRSSSCHPSSAPYRHTLPLRCCTVRHREHNQTTQNLMVIWHLVTSIT